MNSLRAAPRGTKPRRGLSAAVVVAALLAGMGVGVILPDSTTQLDAAHQQVESLTTRGELLSAELTGARTDNSSMADLLKEGEAEVRALGRELDAAERRGDARESKLDQRGKVLDRRQQTLDRQEQDLGQRESTLDRQKGDLGRREAALEQRQEALDQQKSELGQREAALDLRQQALDQREDDLAQQAATQTSGIRGDRG